MSENLPVSSPDEKPQSVLANQEAAEFLIEPAQAGEKPTVVQVPPNVVDETAQEVNIGASN